MSRRLGVDRVKREAMIELRAENVLKREEKREMEER